MQKEQLEQLISENLSSYQIAAKTGKCQATILRWLKKYGLKTNYYQFGKSTNGIRGRYPDIVTDYDWQAIQKSYDNKGTWDTICKEFNLKICILRHAIKIGIFKSRTSTDTIRLRGVLSRTHSPETRAKLSEIRKNYLKSNNLHRWHNKSNHHTSWFCESVKNELKSRNISFTEEYMPLKHINRFFSLDVAIPELKIGFELNGRQHYDAKGELLPYYQKRHDLIVNDGWILHEIKYSKDIKRIVDFIQSKIQL